MSVPFNKLSPTDIQLGDEDIAEDKTNMNKAFISFMQRCMKKNSIVRLDPLMPTAAPPRTRVAAARKKDAVKPVTVKIEKNLDKVIIIFILKCIIVSNVFDTIRLQDLNLRILF